MTEIKVMGAALLELAGVLVAIGGPWWVMQELPFSSAALLIALLVAAGGVWLMLRGRRGMRRGR